MANIHDDAHAAVQRREDSSYAGAILSDFCRHMLNTGDDETPLSAYRAACREMKREVQTLEEELSQAGR